MSAPDPDDGQAGTGGGEGGVVRFVLPVLVLAVGVLAWDLTVRINDIPPYVLPSPGTVLRTLVVDWPILWSSLLTTLATTLEGFVAAAVGGIAIALLFSRSKWLEYSLFPYAIMLQVTPVIAIAPLLLIYLGGAAALVFMAETVGLIGASARLLRFPPVLWVLGVGYGVMARNRPLFARFLFRSDEGPFARPR